MRQALAGLPGRPIDPAAPISALPGGWSAHVFSVTPDWIVRFPQDQAAADRHARERALLPVVAASVSFEVPTIAHVGTYRGLSFSVHRRVRGSAPRRGQIAVEEYAATLADLHDVPPNAVTAAAGLLPSWRARYEHLRAEVDEKVLPVLDGDLAARVARALATFLEAGLAEAGPPRLVHADLGAAHILTIGDRIIGIIDFEDAMLGDPAIDLVGIRLLQGRDFARRVIAQHPRLDESAVGRIDFYTWMGSVHAIVYGVDQGNPAEVAAGIAGLRKRIGW